MTLEHGEPRASSVAGSGADPRVAGVGPVGTRARDGARDPRRSAVDARVVLLGVVAGLAVLVNIPLTVAAVRGFLFAPAPGDWVSFSVVADRIWSGLDPYADPAHAFRWSPLAALALGPITDAGLALWRFAHFLALLAVPRRIAVLLLLTCPFWLDVALGNNLVFSFVLAWHARSSRAAAIAFVAFALLVPRPLYIPLLVWIWLEHRRWRLPIVAVAVISVFGATVTGWADEWLLVLLTTSESEVANVNNFAPSAFLGVFWVLVAWPLAVVAYRRNWLGLSSVLASPYWLPYYWVFLILDARRWNAVLSRIFRRHSLSAESSPA